MRPGSQDTWVPILALDIAYCVTQASFQYFNLGLKTAAQVVANMLNQAPPGAS